MLATLTDQPTETTAMVAQASDLPVLPVVEVKVLDPLDESTLMQLSEQLDDAFSLRPQELVVDLSGCAYMDAQAIRILMDTHIRQFNAGRHMTLRGVNTAAQRLLTIAGVGEVFRMKEVI